MNDIAENGLPQRSGLRRTAKTGTEARRTEATIAAADEVGPLAATAYAAHAAGISCVPIRDDGSKAPAIKSWKKYQTEHASEELLEAWFDVKQRGLAFVTGEISRLEALDFDAQWIYGAFKQRAAEWGMEDLVARVEAGYYEETPDNGQHLLFRVDHPLPNQKLAQEPGDKPGQPKTLIETRGEGGYLVVAPTPAKYHKSNRPWVLQKGGVESIAEVSLDERDALYELARSFNSYEKRSKAPQTVLANERSGRPGDAFNATSSWDDLLPGWGWEPVRDDGEVTYWRHPNKTGPGHSATTNFGGSDGLYVFTTNSAFEADRSYSKFEAYAIVEHDGDFSAAAEQLAREGFGSLPHYDRSDLGNAQRFAAFVEGKALFVRDRRCWFVWNGRHWEADESEEKVHSLYKAVLANSRSEFSQSEDPKDLQWLLRSKSRKSIADTLELAKREPGMSVTSSSFDQSDYLFGVANGVIDLRTGELHTSAPEQMVSKVSGVRFNPLAQSDRWDEFLEWVSQGDVEYAAYLQKVAGLALLGHNLFEKVFVLWGPGGTGKSTFLEALKTILGPYGAAAEPDTLAARLKGRISNDLARLLQYRTVIATEVGEQDVLAMPIIKQLTGGDTVAARRLYQEANEGVGKLNVFLAVNEFPRVGVADSGARRRLVVLPFLKEVPAAKRDYKLKRGFTKDAKHLEAILAWAVEGCLAATEGGIEDLPQVVIDATAQLWVESNPLHLFVEDVCLLDSDGFVSVGELNRAYENWCDDNHQVRVTRSIFKKHLGMLGVEEIRRKSGRFYRGITLDVADAWREVA